MLLGSAEWSNALVPSATRLRQLPAKLRIDASAGFLTIQLVAGPISMITAALFI
jgi:hypothetical protein